MGLLQSRRGANLIGGYFWAGEAVGQIGSRHAPDTQVVAHTHTTPPLGMDFCTKDDFGKIDTSHLFPV